MTKTIEKYKRVFPILVLFYLNFYFLSPFIHEHPVEIEGQLETEKVFHSHLAIIAIPHSDDACDVTNEATSHTHTCSFSIPVIIQSSKKLKNSFSHSTLYQNYEYSKKIEDKFDILDITRFHNQALWEKYVHFATNNSPPTLHSIQHS